MKGRTTETRVIGDAKITTIQLEPFTAFGLMAQLMRVFGPALVGVSMSAPLDGTLVSAFATLTPKDAQDIALAVLAGSTAEIDGSLIDLNTKDKINAAFGGVMDLLLALRFALEVNFGGFFAALPASSDGAQAKAIG